MFDSSYRGDQSRYSKYFTAIDSVVTCLQGDQKSLVYGWKCPHYRRSNLRDCLIYDTRRARDHVWLPISRNPDVRSSKFCSSPQNFLRTSDVWKITKIDSSKVSRFRGQIPGKIKTAEIFVCGTMFDSPYLGRQSRYSRYFIAIDSTPARLQGDQKIVGLWLKMPPLQKVKLGGSLDIWHLSCEGACLTPHISEPRRQNFKISQQSTEHFACIKCVKNNKNRFVGS